MVHELRSHNNSRINLTWYKTIFIKLTFYIYRKHLSPIHHTPKFSGSACNWLRPSCPRLRSGFCLTTLPKEAKSVLKRLLISEQFLSCSIILWPSPGFCLRTASSQSSLGRSMVFMTARLAVSVLRPYSQWHTVMQLKMGRFKIEMFGSC